MNSFDFEVAESVCIARRAAVVSTAGVRCSVGGGVVVDGAGVVVGGRREPSYVLHHFPLWSGRPPGGTSNRPLRQPLRTSWCTVELLSM